MSFIRKNYLHKSSLFRFDPSVSDLFLVYFYCQCFRHSVVAGSDPRRTLPFNVFWAQYLHWKQWSADVDRDVLLPH
jgi:hypothetical protein